MQVGILYKIAKCDSYVLIYIICKKRNSKQSKKKDIIKLLIPVVSFCLSNLITGSRTDTLHLFLAFITIYYILLKKRDQWKHKNNIRFIIKTIVFAFAFLFFFSQIRFFVGRLNTSDPLQYITNYAGGSIQLFDIYIREGAKRSEQWGQLSFYGLWKNIESLGLGTWIPSGLEFPLTNGHQIGNMFTSIRRYYQDFGKIGNLVLQMIMAVFYSACYRNIKNKIDKEILIVLYSFIVPALFLHSIDDIFYAGYVCANTIICMVIIYLIYRLCVKNEKTIS